MKAIGASVFITSAACAVAHADVVIQSRSCFLSASFTYSSIHNTQTDSHLVDVNQLGMSGDRTFGFTSTNAGTFASTVSPTEISATIHGSSSVQGVWPDIMSSSGSARIFVVFAVADIATPMSLTYTGSVFPFSSATDAAVSLTICNLDTGEVVFDLYDHTPPGTGGLISAQWDHESWSTLLAPGHYLLSSEGRPGATYSPGGGSHRSAGSGTLSFSATFGTASPSLAPAPSAAALLTLLPALTLRRRRR